MAGILMMLMIVAIPVLQAEMDAPEQTKGQPVKYRLIGPDDFQSFVKNWDSNKHPVLHALIRSSDEWDAVFGASPVMGGNLPFGPDEKLYDKEQILVVSRVVKPSSTLKVEGVSESNDELFLRYNFVARNPEASFTIKEYFAVVIPKHDYNAIVFIENRKRIGVLNIVKGQWSVPTMPNNPDVGDSK